MVQRPKILFEKNGSWVYEFQGERCLAFEKPLPSVRQTCFILNSPEKLLFNYQKLVLSSLYLNPAAKKVLMIGMGGGTIATAIKNVLPEIHLDIIKINPLVVEVAEDYFMFQNESNVKVIIQDGFDFVLKSNNKYDIIIIDAFLNATVQPKFLTEDFLSSLKNIMSDGGVVVFNSIIGKRNNPNVNFYYRVFREFYDMIDIAEL